MLGQSKHCGGVYTKGTPLVKCFLSPLKTVSDTIVTFVPKNCNDIHFDKTSNGLWKILSSDTLTLLEIVDIKNGFRNGQSFHYFANKRVKAKLTYVNGKLNGDEIIYNEAGQITEKGTYDEQERFNGTVTQYWDNGKIASIQEWKNGWYFGTPKYWDNNGIIIDEKKFEKLWYDCK